MKERNDILTELESVSPALAAMDKVNIFRAPEGYFIALPQRVSTSVFFEQHSKKQVSDIPDNYFDQLSNKILTKIKDRNIGSNAGEELKNIFPLIYSLKDKNVFKAPPAYFESLSDRVVNKVKPERAKIISLHTTRKWWRLAAAAMIAALIGIWGIQLFNNKMVDNNSVPLSATDSENLPAYIQDASRYKTPEELNKGLASLTDDEIAFYLEHHGNIMDDYLLTKDVDTKELPDATDYLMNDNALNNFLKQINDPASSE